MRAVWISISVETPLTSPIPGRAVIVRSIQQGSGELDPLQYGIPAARGGVLTYSQGHTNR